MGDGLWVGVCGWECLGGGSGCWSLGGGLSGGLWEVVNNLINLSN